MISLGQCPRYSRDTKAKALKARFIPSGLDGIDRDGIEARFQRLLVTESESLGRMPQAWDEPAPLALRNSFAHFVSR
jgi:hypothetical protein